jgi:hypothetical protein
MLHGSQGVHRICDLNMGGELNFMLDFKKISQEIPDNRNMTRRSRA